MERARNRGNTFQYNKDIYIYIINLIYDIYIYNKPVINVTLNREKFQALPKVRHKTRVSTQLLFNTRLEVLAREANKRSK